MAKRKESFWGSMMSNKRLTEREYHARINRISIFVVLALVISFIIFIAIAVFGGLYKVLDIITSANMWIYALAFLSVFIGYMIRFIKWNYYLKRLNIRVPLRKNLITYLSLYSMNITPGKFGRILVAYTLNRVSKSKITSTLPVVTFDIFTDFLGVGIVALIAALYFKIYVIYVVAIDIALLLPYLFILNNWFYNFLKSKMKNSRFFLRFSVYGDEYFAFQNRLNTPKTYIVSIAVSVPAAVFNALALYFVLVAVGVHPNVTNSIFIQTSSQMLGMATGSPGNLGVTDGALVALIRGITGISVAKSSAVTIMERFATLWFGVGMGSIFLVYSMRYWRSGFKFKRKRDRR